MFREMTQMKIVQSAGVQVLTCEPSTFSELKCECKAKLPMTLYII